MRSVLGFVRMVDSSLVLTPKTWYFLLQSGLSGISSLRMAWILTLLSLHWNVSLVLSLPGEAVFQTSWNFILYLPTPGIDHRPKSSFHSDFFGFFFAGPSIWHHQISANLAPQTHRSLGKTDARYLASLSLHDKLEHVLWEKAVLIWSLALVFPLSQGL